MYTHVGFQKKDSCARVVLVGVDEQHRFGVEQRMQLRQRGQQDSERQPSPHTLMMSATPIPRSLANHRVCFPSTSSSPSANGGGGASPEKVHTTFTPFPGAFFLYPRVQPLGPLGGERPIVAFRQLWDAHVAREALPARRSQRATQPLEGRK